MKKDHVFCGNEICCASYAFRNTVQEDGINCRLFEITSTVPFGVKHRREKDFSRLLTTYCDPNIGVERAAPVWGYRQKKERFIDGDDASDYIAERSREGGCLVGPVDMGQLGYLLLPNLYTNMDHYIAVYQEKGQMYCMDSEGIPARGITKEEMRRWFRAGNLPEAKGYLTVRSFEKEEMTTGQLREEAAVRGCVEQIRSNMKEAEGGRAVIQCCGWLTENPVSRWKLSFLYDISYLMQRKILQADWLEYAVRFSVCEEKEGRAMKEILREEIRAMQWIFRSLQKENRICAEQFYRLAQLEEQLTAAIVQM